MCASLAGLSFQNMHLKGQNYRQSWLTDKQLHLIQISTYLVKSYLISVASYHSPVIAVFSSRGACTVVRTILFTVHKNGKMTEKMGWKEPQVVSQYAQETGMQRYLDLVICAFCKN